MMKAHPAHPRRARGIALFEALIAVLLLSLSALAYAALQMRGLSTNSSAMWRSKAVQLAQEMADRMRANQVGVGAGAYQNLLAPAAAPVCGVGSACTPTQVAKADYSAWSAEIALALPGGTGIVCLDGTPDDGSAAAPACDGAAGTYAIKLFWTERGVDSRVAMELRP
ncbi:MAG: type IV pilus modification protein PilV [Burkholderiales bacterium]|nr:type IV pilus modification protein PilV [Burkholderiales bacterium]